MRRCTWIMGQGYLVARNKVRNAPFKRVEWITDLVLPHRVHLNRPSPLPFLLLSVEDRAKDEDIIAGIETDDTELKVLHQASWGEITLVTRWRPS